MSQPKVKRENKWISRGLKQGSGLANLSKKIENKWIRRVIKQEFGAGQPKEKKKENKWISRV